jgi:hypothetical protein
MVAVVQAVRARPAAARPTCLRARFRAVTASGMVTREARHCQRFAADVDV